MFLKNFRHFLEDEIQSRKSDLRWKPIINRLCSGLNFVMRCKYQNINILRVAEYPVSPKSLSF